MESLTANLPNGVQRTEENDRQYSRRAADLVYLCSAQIKTSAKVFPPSFLSRLEFAKDMAEAYLAHSQQS
jgi:hypothetical protein